MKRQYSGVGVQGLEGDPLSVGGGAGGYVCFACVCGGDEDGAVQRPEVCGGGDVACCVGFLPVEGYGGAVYRYCGAYLSFGQGVYVG